MECQEFCKALEYDHVYISKSNRIISSRTGKKILLAIGCGGMKIHLQSPPVKRPVDSLAKSDVLQSSSTMSSETIEALTLVSTLENGSRVFAVKDHETGKTIGLHTFHPDGTVTTGFSMAASASP